MDYTNILRRKYLIKEEYNLGLLKRLTSRLGLRKIEVDQETKNILVNTEVIQK